MTEATEATTAAGRKQEKSHVVVGEKTLTAWARTKAGKEAITAAGLAKESISSVYDSHMAAKKVVRALRQHIKGEDGAVIRGAAKVETGAEPAPATADA